MNNFETQFARFVISWRWVIVASTLLIVGAAAYGCKNLYLSSSYRVMFGEDNPQLLAFDEIEKKYSKNDNVMIVVSPKDRNIYNPETLRAVAELTKEAWQTPYSSRVDSITNFQHTEAEEDDLIVADLVGNPAGADLERIRRIATSEPLLVDL